MSAFTERLGRSVSALSSDELPLPGAVRRTWQRAVAPYERARARVGAAIPSRLRLAAAVVLFVVSVAAAFGIGYATTNGETTSPATATVDVTGTTTPRSSTTTLAARRGESPSEFLALLAAAIRNGDAAFLIDRVNPVVIRRYGDTQCRAWLASLKDVTRQFTVQDVGPASNYEWASDGRSVTVLNTLAVTVTAVVYGQNASQTIHLTKVGDHFTWFTDCGDPIGP